MFYRVTGDGEANKKLLAMNDHRIMYRFVNEMLRDERGILDGRQRIYIRDATKEQSKVAGAVIFLEKREPIWVIIGSSRYKDLWDFLGYCDISERKITFKNNRNTKWIVGPDSIRLLSRGKRDAPPLAVFNSVRFGNPTDQNLMDVLYIDDGVGDERIFETIVGYFLMEYLRKRVFVIKTKSALETGNGALNVWPKFRDILIPVKYREQPTNSKSSTKKKARKLRRCTTRVPLPPNKKLASPVHFKDPVVTGIMGDEDSQDPLRA